MEKQITEEQIETGIGKKTGIEKGEGEMKIGTKKEQGTEIEIMIGKEGGKRIQLKEAKIQKDLKNPKKELGKWREAGKDGKKGIMEIKNVIGREEETETQRRVNMGRVAAKEERGIVNKIEVNRDMENVTEG